MADWKQKNNLSALIDGVEKDHKADIQLYISGHLNPNKLYKPPRNLQHHIWASGKKSAYIIAKTTPFTTPKTFTGKVTGKTKCTLDDFTDVATPTATRAKSAAHSYGHRQEFQASSCSPVRASLDTPTWARQTEDTEKKIDEEAGKPLIREELDVPELKLLKYKPMWNSRLCVTEGTTDEYQFLPSYLAGVTKTDQFHTFVQFEKDFIAKKDLLENDFIGSKIAQQHEKKLAQVLQNICDCTRPHFNRLQAVGEVFEDICHSSLIFGDILKEVKNEYELYIVILLDSLPTLQYRTLQNELAGMEKRRVKTHEIVEARRELQVLLQKSKQVLERNEELRNMLEVELRASQTPPEMSESDREESPNGKARLCCGEQLESLRLQILAKWEEIQLLKKEIKDTMIFAGIASIREKTVKELENEAAKLEASNKFLKKQIKDVEDSLDGTLRRQKITPRNQRSFWELMNSFLVRPSSEESIETEEELFVKLGSRSILDIDI